MGGLLNILLDPLFMFVILPDGRQVLGAAIATLLSNIIALIYFIATYRKACKETVLQIHIKGRYPSFAFLPRQIVRYERDRMDTGFGRFLYRDHFLYHIY